MCAAKGLFGTRDAEFHELFARPADQLGPEFGGSPRWLDDAGFTQTEIHRKKPTYATILGVRKG